MAGMNITSLGISVTSNGIDDAVSALNNLTTAAGGAEKASGSLSNSGRTLSDSQKSSVDAVTRLIEKMQKQADLLGANTSQTNAYNAALKGATAAQQSMVTFLGAEVDAYKESGKAQAEVARQNKAQETAARTLAAAEQEYLNTLKLKIATHEKDTSTTAAATASMRGYSQATVEEARKLGAELDKVGAGGEGAMSKLGLGTVGAKRELMVLGHEAMQGNFSKIPGSFLVLAERMDITNKIFSLAALGWVSAAVIFAALVYEVAKGREEFTKLNDALKDTGNYSGVTTKQVYDMGERIGSTTGQTHQAIEALTLLSATGRVTGSQLELAGKTAVMMAKDSGKSIEDVVGSMKGLSDDALKWAQDYQKQHHFMTAAQLELITSLSNEGKEARATTEVLNALNEAHSRMHPPEKGGAIMEWWKEWGIVVSKVKGYIMSIGAPDSNFDLINKALAERTRLEKELKIAHDGNAVDAEKQVQKLLNANLIEINALRDKKKVVEDTAKVNEKIATDADHKQKNIDYLGSSQYASKALQKSQAQQKENKDFAIATEGYVAGTKEFELATIRHNENMAQIDKQFTEKVKKPQGDGMTGVNAELKALEGQASAEQVVYASRIKMIDDYHKYGFLSDAQAAEAKINTYTDMTSNTTKYYDLEIDALQKFITTKAGLSPKERNIALKDIEEIKTKKDKALSDEMAKSTEASLLEQGNANLVIIAEQNKADKVVESLKKQTDGVQFQIDAYNALPDSVRKAGVTVKQQQDYITQAKIDSQEKEITNQQENLRSQDENVRASAVRQIAILTAQVAEEKKLRDAQTGLEAIQAQNLFNQSLTTEWDKTVKKYDGMFMTGFENALAKGKGNWTTFTKSLATTFKTNVVDQLYKMFVQPFAMKIIASVIGIGGSTATNLAQAAQGSTSSLGGLGNLYSAGKSLWDGFSGGMAAAGSVGTGFLGSMVGGLAGGMPSTAVAGTYLTSDIGLSIGTTIADVVGPEIASGLATGIEGLAAAAPWLALAAGAAYVLKAGFGHGERESTSAGIEGNFSTSSGFSGNSFNNWKEKGGWFSSDNTGKDTANLDNSAQTQMSAGFSAIKTAAEDSAKALGLSSESIANYSQKISVDLTSDAANNSKAITKLFTDVSDNIANTLAPSVSSFAHTGETSSVTLARLSNSLTAVNSMFDSLNLKAYEASLAGGDMASKLADLFGGLSNMQSQSAAYFKSYYTEQEQVDTATRQLTKNFNDLGYVMPSSKDALRGMIQALDLTTDAGRNSYVQLITLSGAFATLDTATKNLVTTQAASTKATDIATKQRELDISLMTAQGDAAGALAAQRVDELKALALLDPSLVKTQQAIYDATDAANKLADATANAAKVAADNLAILSKSVTDAKSVSAAAFTAQIQAVTDSKDAATIVFNDTKTAITDTLNTAKTANSVIASLASSLQSTLDSMVVAIQPVGMAWSSANAQISSALTTAQKTGVLPTAESLAQALKTVSNGDSSRFSSSTDYAKDVGVTAGKIADLNKIAGAQKSVSDMQLTALQSSLDVLQATYNTDIKNFDKQTKALQLAQAAESTRLDGILKNAQDQLSVMNGTYVATMDVVSAINAFSSALTAAINAGNTAGTTVTASQVTATDTVVVNGSHASGLDNVPFDGYTAKLHKGEMVLPASSAQAVRDDTSNKEILAAIIKLCEENSAENQAMASNLVILRKLFQQAMPGGTSLQTTAV